MNTTLTQIADYLWNQSWQVALLVATIGLVCHLMRNRSAHPRYLLWLLVPAKCLVPPLLGISLPILPQPPRPVLPIPTDRLYSAAVEASAVEALLPSSAPSSDLGQRQTDARRGILQGLSIPEILAIVWLAGAGLLALVTLLKAGRMTRWRMSWATPYAAMPL